MDTGERIREAATNIARKVIVECGGGLDPAELTIATNTIIVALLAEQERAAKIAEAVAKKKDAEDSYDPWDYYWDSGYIAGAESVAEAIRS